jgi:hypothetical protein
MMCTRLWNTFFSNSSIDESHSVCYKPILDNVDSIEMENPADYQLLGFLTVSVYWRDILANILPRGDNGLVVVFENECNPTFTFQLDGPNVTFLGRGDLHDPAFDYLQSGVSDVDLNPCFCYLSCSAG